MEKAVALNDSLLILNTCFENLQGVINMHRGISLVTLKCIFRRSYSERAINVENINDVKIQNCCFALCSLNKTNKTVMFGCAVNAEDITNTKIISNSFIRCCGPFLKGSERYVISIINSSISNDNCNFSNNNMYVGPGQLLAKSVIISFTNCIHDNLHCDNVISNLDRVSNSDAKIGNLVYTFNRLDSNPIESNKGCIIIISDSNVVLTKCIFIENNTSTLIRNMADSGGQIVTLETPLLTHNLSTIGNIDIQSPSYTSYEEVIYVGDVYACLVNLEYSSKVKSRCSQLIYLSSFVNFLIL